MEPVDLIVAALLAGAAAATDSLAAQVVKDSYAALKGLLQKRFRRIAETTDDAERPGVVGGRMTVDPEVVLEAHESDPETWDKPVREALRSTGADHDDDILAAAQALLDAAEVGGPRVGKYQVDARGAQGVQVGDHGTMTNTFNTPPDLAVDQEGQCGHG